MRLATKTLQEVYKLLTIMCTAPPTEPKCEAVPRSNLYCVFGVYFTCGASALPVPAAACAWHSPKSLATVFTRNL